MSIRDSIPTPDQGAVVAGDTAAQDAEVGAKPLTGDEPDEESAD